MSYASLHYHIVFSTKGRRPFLRDERLSRVCQYLGGAARELKCRLLLGGGAADHVHLAASIHQALAVADFVKEIKVASSKWIHTRLAGMADFAWQDGYAAFTVSNSMLSKVVGYIERQEAHHRKKSYQEELIALLKRHGVEYDERYIWR